MVEVEAKKLQMGQIFSEDGKVIPVTEVSFKDLPEDLVVGTEVEVVGTSKGKGFAGVMKRHGFAGGPATHGQSDRQRAPGSIGGTTTPGRVYKGKKMAGRMGGARVTVKGLSVVLVDGERKIVKISGSIPGPSKSKIVLRYEPKGRTENRERGTGGGEQTEKKSDD
ncbi:50S ribosomal protein L3 [Candidatus Saccharibacteria bacterium]|nr:50S ribosomal protein L3 [Candidatus Saccharibacteria bacterium]